MPQHHVYRPRITFQDTNVVGNVYFLTFFRWQADCRDEWIRTTRPDLWAALRTGATSLVVTDWSTRFIDPIGATVGDEISVRSEFVEDAHGVSAASVMAKKREDGFETIATGQMRFTTATVLRPPLDDAPHGPCYEFSATFPRPSELSPLDLLAWQGKCRELFLADHAPASLRAVAKGKLVLQTTLASLSLVELPEFPLEDIRVQLRLKALKCGQMDTRFDFFAHGRDGRSARIAQGEQRMSSKRVANSQLAACPVPVDILDALRRFTDSNELLRKISDVVSFIEPSESDPSMEGKRPPLLATTPRPDVVCNERSD